jgi:chromosome partitioning protein
MRAVSLVSQKGGAGKTTLAIHLAVLAREGGKSVVLIDCDPQRSATKWWGRRTDADLTLVTRNAGDLPEVLKAARVDGYDFAIIDTAPHADAAAASAARTADFALIPCRPAILDLDAVAATVDLVKAIRKRAAIVLNACPPGRGISSASLTTDARRALRSHDLPVAPATITQRAALAHALIDGRAVTEFEPEGKAATEIRALWSWIQAHA